jgi:hypothetical protein
MATHVRPGLLSLAFVSLVCLAAAGTVDAQTSSETPRYGAAIVGATFGDGETATAVSASLGFSFAHHVGVDFELAYAGHLAFTLDTCPDPRACSLDRQIPVIGRTVSLQPHVVFDLPSPWSRVRTYAVAGAGITHLRQWYAISDSPRVERKRSKIAPAVSFGGGVAVQIARRAALGADVRSVRLFDDEATADRFIVPAGAISTVRVGSRVSWQF